MDKKTKAVHELVAEIYATQPVELFCDHTAVLMARAADSGLSEADLQKLYPELWQHFRVCPNCTAEYQMVMELAHADLLEPTNVPPIPELTSASAPFWGRVKEFVQTSFPGFQPDLSLAIQRGQDSLQIEPVTLPLTPDMELSFDVTTHETDGSQRDLFCTLLLTTDEGVEQYEGSPLWLQQVESGFILQEQLVDTLGDAMFSSIEPGSYNLLLFLGQQQYLITDVIVP